MSDCNTSETSSDVDNISSLYKASAHYSLLIERLQQQKNDEEFCDVVLIVEEYRFAAHRCVLSVFSDYFHKMFTTNMKEKHTKEIKIEDVSADAMKIIITSMYSGEISLSEQTIVDVLHAASLMQVTIVMEAAEIYMSDTICAKNSCLYRYLTELYSFEKLSDQIKKIFLQSFDFESSRVYFLRLKFKDLNEFLPSDDLNVDEELNVFQFIVEWVEKRLETRKQHFPFLFKHVRLQFVPIKSLNSVVKTNNLVNEFSECKMLLENAILFYENPNIRDSQKQRKCLAGKPDSLMMLASNSKYQQVFDPKMNEVDNVVFEGFNTNTFLLDCAFAQNFPRNAFCGGVNANNVATNQVVEFNGVCWMNLPPMIERRCGAAAVFYGEDLYVFGGEKFPVSRTSHYQNGQANPSAANCVKNYEFFCNCEWKVGTYLSKISRSYSVALVVNKIIYTIGGYILTSPDDGFVINTIPCKVSSASIFKFFPEESTWEEGISMCDERAEFGATVFNQKIFVVGGYGPNQCSVNTTEFFDTINNSWTYVTYLSYQSICYDATLIPKLACVNETMYMLCGKFYTFDKIGLKWKELGCNKIVRANVMLPYSRRLHLRPVVEPKIYR